MARSGSRLTPDEQLAAGLLDRMLATPRGRRTLAWLAVATLLGFCLYWLWQSSQGAHSARATGPTVRIATWNMHVFAPRPSIDLNRIAGIITENRFDLLALQEVRDDGAEVDALLNTLGRPWRGTRVSDETGNHEYFEFIYNGDHVQELHSAHTVATTEVTTFNRWPFQASFQAGQFRFTLVTAHLYYGKSEAGSRRIEPRDLERRQAEAQALAHIAGTLESSSDLSSVIVLGDFNEQRAHGFLHCFEDQGWQRLINDPTNLSSTEIFDNILIDPRVTHEWTGRSGSVHFDEAYFPGDRHLAVEAVSDHRPAWADFRTGVPATAHQPAATPPVDPAPW